VMQWNEVRTTAPRHARDPRWGQNPELKSLATIRVGGRWVWAAANGLDLLPGCPS